MVDASFKQLPHDLAALSQRLQSFLWPPGQKRTSRITVGEGHRAEGGKLARRCILAGVAAYGIPIYHLSLFFGKWRREIYVRTFLTQHLTRKTDERQKGAVGVNKSEVAVKGNGIRR